MIIGFNIFHACEKIFCSAYLFKASGEAVNPGQFWACGRIHPGQVANLTAIHTHIHNVGNLVEPVIIYSLVYMYIYVIWQIPFIQSDWMCLIFTTEQLRVNSLA